MQKYGISEAERAARKELTDKQAASLETALGRLDPPVSFDDASKEWIFCDTSKSVERAGATKGHAPTLTASSRAVWCTRLGRHLYPIEHGLLQGWQDDQIQARASARACAWRVARACACACAWRILRLRVLYTKARARARAPVAPVGALGGLCRRLR